MQPTSVLLIGDAARDEFRAAHELLAAKTELTLARGVAEAADLLASGRLIEPDLIVLAAAAPGEFPDADLDRLRRAAPLSRAIALVGTWSEGETRSGQPWSGVWRIYAHQFVPRFGAELVRLAAGGSPIWSLPVTATDEERLLAMGGTGILPVPEHRRGAIGLATRDLQTAEVLGEACRGRGYAVTRLTNETTDNGRRTTDNLVAALWDGRGCDEREARELRTLVERLPGTPVLALLGFPRAEDCRRAIDCGAAAVVSKPFLLDDLFWQLDRLIGVRGEK